MPREREERSSGNYIIRRPLSIFYKRHIALLIKKKIGATSGAPKFIFAMVVNIAKASQFYLIPNYKCQSKSWHNARTEES